MPATGLHTLLSRDKWFFHNVCLDSERDQLNPVIIVVLIITPTHLHKTVVCSEQSMCKKGVDNLPDHLLQHFSAMFLSFLITTSMCFATANNSYI